MLDQFMPNHNAMTRQRTFAKLVSRGDLSDVEAARRAGYALASAHVSAHANRRRPAVSELIEKECAVVERQHEVTRELVLKGLLQEAEHGNTSSARTAAWTQLGRALGMFTDKVHQTQEYDHAAAAERINDRIEAVRLQGAGSVTHC